MQSITLSMFDYKKLVGSVRRATDPKGAHRYLSRILLKVYKDRIEAYGCNGYFSLKYTLYQKNEEEFTAMILPRVPKCKCTCQVTITHNSETGIDSVKIDLNKEETIIYNYDNKSLEYRINLDSLFSKDTSYDREVAVSPVYLTQLSSSFSEINAVNNYVRLITKQDASAIVHMSTEDSSSRLDAILLPVRR